MFTVQRFHIINPTPVCFKRKFWLNFAFCVDESYVFSPYIIQLHKRSTYRKILSQLGYVFNSAIYSNGRLKCGYPITIYIKLEYAIQVFNVTGYDLSIFQQGKN